MTTQTISKRGLTHLSASLLLIPTSFLLVYCFSAVALQAWKAEPERPNYPDGTVIEPKVLPEAPTL